MSAKDIIKKTVLESFGAEALSQYDVPRLLMAMLIALVMGCLIFIIYRRFYTGVVYSHSFGVTLVGMTVLTCMVTLAISTNIVISLGMVGALSIVRFRTAVKDPLDTAYMFWALTMGILLGAGQYFLTAITVVCIAILIFVLRNLAGKSADSYLLVMHLSGNGEANSMQLMKQLRYHKLKSKTITSRGIEVTYEVRVDKSEAFLNKLLTLDGVNEASLVAYQSETV